MLKKWMIGLFLVFGFTQFVHSSDSLFWQIEILNFWQDEFKVDKEKLTLNKGNEFTDMIKITGTEIAHQNVEIRCKSICDAKREEETDVYKISLTENYKNSIKFKKDDTNEVIEIAYPKEKPIKIFITLHIPARFSGLTIKKGETNLPASLSFELIETQSEKLTITNKIDGTEETDKLFLETKENNVVDISGTTITAKNKGRATIQLYGEKDKEESKVGSITVTVSPSIKVFESAVGNSFDISEDDTRFVKLKVLGTDNRPLPDLKRIDCAPIGSELLSVITDKDGIYVKATLFPKQNGSQSDTQSVKITCKIKEKLVAEPQDFTIAVKIFKKNGYIEVDSLNGNTLLPNGSLSFFVRVFTTLGSPENAGIKYDLENVADKQWVSLTPQGSKLIVNWVNLPNGSSNQRPEFVNIEIKANINTDNPIISRITIHFASVTKFSSLKVKLNVMDSRTASDLYGNVTNDEYYVLMVRLFNDLKDRETNRYEGQSILAYSSSIEVAVGLEKKYDKDSKSAGITVIEDDKVKELKKKRVEEATSLFEKNLEKINKIYDGQLKEFNKLMKEAVEQEEVALDLEIRAKVDPSLENEAKKARENADFAYKKAMAFREKIRNLYQDNILPLPQVSLPTNVAVNDGNWYPASRDDLINIANQEAYLSTEDDDSNVSINDDEPNCLDTITYRPFTFEMMVNTVDRRDERTKRSRIFQLLNFASLGLSAVTSVAVPGKTSDLPLGIEKYGNLIIPGLEKLFPNLKEQHRQNIVSQAMKPIEEIPFGSDITRVVFIPKKPIEGLIVGHKARISQICPFYFKVKVAIVTKGADVRLGNQQIR